LKKGEKVKININKESKSEKIN